MRQHSLLCFALDASLLIPGYKVVGSGADGPTLAAMKGNMDYAVADFVADKRRLNGEPSGPAFREKDSAIDRTLRLVL